MLSSREPTDKDPRSRRAWTQRTWLDWEPCYALMLGPVQTSRYRGVELNCIRFDFSTTVDSNVALNSCRLVPSRLFENTPLGDWGEDSCKMAYKDSSMEQRKWFFLCVEYLQKEEE